MTAALLRDGPGDAARLVVLAHGAGAPMDSPFMAAVADGLGDRGLGVARFEFPYMAARRAGGGRRPPDRTPVLLQAYRAAVAALGDPARLVIGGKSLGGRIASMLADELGVAGLVCLGYPFHPPRRRDAPRIEHLRTLRTPALIVQGERDPFGTAEEVAGYPLAGAIEVAWMPDGDHSFVPRARSGHTESGNLAAAVAAVARFVASLR